jgi:flagellar biosynthesis component FlhA
MNMFLKIRKKLTLKNLHIKNIRTIAEIIKSEGELSNDFKIEVERIRQSMT